MSLIIGPNYGRFLFLLSDFRPLCTTHDTIFISIVNTCAVSSIPVLVGCLTQAGLHHQLNFVSIAMLFPFSCLHHDSQVIQALY